MKKNKKVMIWSLVAGFASWLAYIDIYDIPRETIPRPLLVAGMALLLFLATSILVLISSADSGSFDTSHPIYVNGGKTRVAAYFAAGAFAVFILAFGGEWLYELSPYQKVNNPTSYVFLLDESGSTSDSDPYGKRYSAVNDLMQDSDLPYVVYGFSSDTRIIREMGKHDEEEQITPSSDGGTSILGGLETVLDDYRNKIWDGGVNPKILLFSDGYATDIGNGFFGLGGNMGKLQSVLREYSKNGLSISTVGLADADDKLMQRISYSTGGVYVSVADADNLGEAMKNAAEAYAERDLFSVRYVRELDVLYAVARVAILAILGAFIGLFQIIAYMDSYSTPLISVTSLSGALMAAIITELGLKYGLLEPQSAMVLFCLLNTCTIGYSYITIKKPKRHYKKGNTVLYSGKR